MRTQYTTFYPLAMSDQISEAREKPLLEYDKKDLMVLKIKDIR